MKTTEEIMAELDETIAQEGTSWKGDAELVRQTAKSLLEKPPDHFINSICILAAIADHAGLKGTAGALFASRFAAGKEIELQGWPTGGTANRYGLTQGETK